MQLELKDLTNNQTILIPPDGITFGREGGDADVQFKDGGVSKRHARVYQEAEVWYLEDLGSSNGTFLQTARIQQPTELMPGDIFSMSKVRVEVLQMVDDEGRDEEDDAPPPAPAPRKPAPAAARPQPKPATAPKKAAEPARAEPAARKPASAAPRPGPAKNAQVGGGEADSAKGVGYFFIAVPKAIAYYLAKIPVLLVNPIGTVKKTIEEQPAEPMGRMELIAYAIPPLLLSQLLGSIGAGIAMAVHGTFSVMTLIPIVPTVIALVSAVITGLIWHPVLGWVIRFLKGESDERSRTNYFLNQMTVTAVLAVPAFVSALLGLVPFRLISVVGVLLMLVAQLATMYLFWAWFTFFNVVKWFRIVILALAGLGVLGGLYSAVMLLIHPVPSVGSASSATEAVEAASAAAADNAEAIKQAQEQAAAAMKAAGADPEAIKEATAKALAAAKEAGEKNAALAKEAAEKAAKETAKATAAAKEAADKGTKEAAAAANEAAAAAKEAGEAPTASEKTAAARPPAGGSGYSAYAALRKEVEKRIEEDPTLLNRVPGLKDLYRNYLADVYKIDLKYQKATGKKPEEARLNAYLREAELYSETGKQLEDIAKKLR